MASDAASEPDPAPLPAPAPKGPSRARRLWTAINSEANGIIALLTIVLALASIWQWQLTDRSLELTRRSLDLTRESIELTRQQLTTTKAVERAHVVVEDISPLSLSSRYGSVTARLRNVGRVPAEAVEVMTITPTDHTFGKLTELPCVWLNSEMVPVALAAGQDTSVATGQFEITQDMAGRIYRGDAKMFLWFSISYRDAFGPVHETSCFSARGSTLATRFRPPMEGWQRCGIHDFKRNGRTQCE
jgi:hypothetical protein